MLLFTKKEVTTIGAVFPEPSAVTALLVQRVLEQHATMVRRRVERCMNDIRSFRRWQLTEI